MQAHEVMRLGAFHMGQTRHPAVAAIAQQEVFGPDRKTRQAFAAVRIGQLQMIAAQRGQPQTVVEAPVRARGGGSPAGWKHPPRAAGILGPGAARPGPRPRLARERPGELLQPVAGVAQTLEQRHVREFSQSLLPRPDTGLTQRQAGGHVQQQHAQEGLRVRNAARAEQRLRGQRGSLPACGQQGRNDLPLLIELRVIQPACNNSQRMFNP